MRIREDNAEMEACRDREKRRIHTNGEKITRIQNTEGYGIVQNEEGELHTKANDTQSSRKVVIHLKAGCTAEGMVET